MNDGAVTGNLARDICSQHIQIFDLDARIVAAQLVGEMHGRLRVYSISGLETKPTPSRERYRAKQYTWPRRLDSYLAANDNTRANVSDYLILDLINDTTGAGKFVPPYMDRNDQEGERHQIAQAYMQGFASTCQNKSLQDRYFARLRDSVLTTFRGIKC